MGAAKRELEGSEEVEDVEAGPSGIHVEEDKQEKSSKPLKKKKKSAPTPGIVYISRLPPGMTPQKVKHLMGRWGDVGRVYAQRRDGRF